MRVRETGFGNAYDRYADCLYTYCRFHLRDPADTLDAVEDTFLTAAARLASPVDDDLADQEWFRVWLYAVARNQCLGRIKSGQAATAFDAAYDDAAGGDSGFALLRAALRGLTPAERDVMVMLWHGLDVGGIAAVLGISDDAALSLFSLARERLETSAAALLTARAGRRSCAGLSAVLGDWNGRLTVPLGRKLTQHIDRCAACAARRRQESGPALLLSLTPGALLGAAVTPEALRRASATTRALRDQVLNTAADPSPNADVVRAAAARRAGPFGENRFPKPLSADSRGTLGRPRLRAAAAAVGVAAAAATVVVIVIASGGGEPAGSPSADAGLAGAARHSAGDTAATLGGTVPTRGAPRTRGASPSPTGSPSPSTSPQPSVPTSAVAVESPAASRSTSAGPSAGASASPSRTTASPSPSPARATLSVPSSVTLTPQRRQWQGTLPVTVRGGSLPWSIAPDQGLEFSQASGTTSATITISGFGRGNYPPITISAGDKTYTVNVTTQTPGW